MKRDHRNDHEGDADRPPRIEEIDVPIKDIDAPIKGITWADVEGTWEQQGDKTWDDLGDAA